jgi:hypothetical protein
MLDEGPEGKPALPAVRQPTSPPAPTGLDWRGFWDAVKSLIRSGTKLGGQIDATTQTAADDVLLGKVGIITARVAAGKAGEIRLPVRGGTQDYIACAQTGLADTMEVNSTAEVVAFMPPNTVFVKP